MRKDTENFALKIIFTNDSEQRLPIKHQNMINIYTRVKADLCRKTFQIQASQ